MSTPCVAVLEASFQVRQKGSTLGTEILAGVSTFLVLSYIFVVNPAILAQAGMNASAVLFATILASGLSTIAMGLWANVPFVLAPGMEMNAYIAYFAVGTLGLTFREALGAVFWSGVLFLILTLLGVRQKMIDAIPGRLKTSLSLSVGVFLVIVAFRIAGLLRFTGTHVVGVGALLSTPALALYLGITLALLLERIKVRAAILFSILASAAFCHMLHLPPGQPPAVFSLAMLGGIGAADISVLARPRAFGVILLLFLIDFYGSVAKLIGLSQNTSIQQDGQLPGMRRALVVDSFGTILASLTGTSNLTVYVESGVGIGVGGRTGLTAIVCGSLMLGCFAIAPLLSTIPLAATTGALVFVAIKLWPSASELRTFTPIDLLMLTAMQITVLITFALDQALLVGLSVVTIATLASRKSPDPYAVVSLILLGIGAVLR
jgi:AGZA family xanthine/uracil permease-like MFS transporter